MRFRWQWASLVVVFAIAAVAGLWRVTASRGSCADTTEPPAKLNYTLKDMNGADVALASFKGRPLVLNFWATWCGPCKEEIPALIELAEKYRDKDLVILGISVDDKPDELKKFAAEYKMNYPVLVGLAHDDFLLEYDADVAVPITWFVTPCGTVSAKHPGIGSHSFLDEHVRALF